ncbi:MAG: CBS domain-containing protein, partial [Phycisphaeraceae bacterium]|nr:CBS domain-containing protein [Phycisphaeraceae bacterium]
MTVRSVMLQMNKKQIGCVLVADEKRHLHGVFTDRDILNRVVDSFDHLENKPITEVMTPAPWVVYEVDNMATVLSAMAIGELRHVPVLDVDGRVIGLITPRRILAFIQQQIRGTDPSGSGNAGADRPRSKGNR